MSIETRLKKLESVTVEAELSQWKLTIQGEELGDWQLVTVLRVGGSTNYAENVVTGERVEEGYYLDAIRKDKSYRAIEVVIGKPSSQSIEVGGVGSV